MKKLLLVLVFFAIVCESYAQSMGIGTNTPDPSAKLDISSTTQGLLIPRMSTSQKFDIDNPKNGLLVYDTDKNELYQYTGTTWKAILNGNYWSRPITSRDVITNSADSVGIGTNSVTQRLDVNGNIRSRQGIFADGTVQGNLLVSTGNLVALGTGTFNGNLLTNGDLIVNDASAILQFKNSGVNKGFIQLSGNDFRLGTNAGNNAKIILRSDGVDRMTVFENGNVNIGSSAVNAARLRVAGDVSVQDNVIVQDDISMGGKMFNPNVQGATNYLTPLCYGSVKNGLVQRKTNNVTVTWVPYDEYTGYYKISCTGINSGSIIMATCNDDFTGGTDNIIVSANAMYYSAGVAHVHLITFYRAAEQISTGKWSFSFVIY
jgi:hypothetical protein